MDVKETTPETHAEQIDAISRRSREAQSAPCNEGVLDWAIKDRRRGELIDKKHTLGLDLDERQELERLQAELEERLDAVAPISFAVVEAMEEVIRAIKSGTNEEQAELHKP